LDVPKRGIRIAVWGAILLIALLLRLKGIHDPILDHPGWRQGDTASIAKNFATLRYDIFYPQTNYDGPPPNYVELELQILPFVAATIYKAVGIHEIIGRIVSIAFSLGTVAILGYFGRWLFASEIAGAFAALVYAIEPGSFYYGRTFTPDTTMVFFMTAALFVIARLLIDRERWNRGHVAGACALLTLAYLAKPVSLVALVPILALVVARALAGRTMQWGAIATLLLVPVALLYGYDRFVASHAEWHWASGIVTLHVLPALRASFSNGHALLLKLKYFAVDLRMLVLTMLGPAIAVAGAVGLFFLPPSTRSRTLIWSWLTACTVYIYAVVTVERVDYYMYVVLPLFALTSAALLSRLVEAVAFSRAGVGMKYAAAILGVLAAAGVVYQNRELVAPYYRYSKAVYRNAIALQKTLPPGTLVVMGHYDPSILYYIGHFGWEEDPYVWTPFDEQSAIRKGARYYIDIEHNRFAKNVELCAWMQRFPVINPNARWIVYRTDPSLIKPGADAQWRAFRSAERRGLARAWLTAHHECLPTRRATRSP
jgi:hypothetical protein